MITFPVFKCLRCQYEWTPRKQEVKNCPRCKSPYWNKEKIRINKSKQRNENQEL